MYRTSSSRVRPASDRPAGGQAQPSLAASYASTASPEGTIASDKRSVAVAASCPPQRTVGVSSAGDASEENEAGRVGVS